MLEGQIYNQIFKKDEVKTELSSDKLKLAAINDVKELVSDGERILGGQKDGLKWGERAEREYKEVMKVVGDAEGILRGANRRASQFLDQSQTILNKFEVAAKEVGVNPNSVKEYANVLRLRKDILDTQNPVSGFMQALQKLL